MSDDTKAWLITCVSAVLIAICVTVYYIVVPSDLQTCTKQGCSFYEGPHDTCICPTEKK